MSRPSFIKWATSKGGVYLHDKAKPTLATWQPYQVDILNHVFPGGDQTLPYSRVLWCDVKKSGKSELSYGVHLWFSLFVDVPGEQYVLANDFEGARSRVFRALIEGIEKNPTFRDSDWKLTGSEMRFSNGSTIKAIASDYRGEAGSNHSLASVDEPWGIIHQNALRLMTEFGPVPTRPNSTIFYTGYQGFEGQSDFWHNMIDEVRNNGEPVPELLHIDDGDGQPACWRAGRMFLFWNHAGKQPWHTPEYYAEERRAYRGRENEFIRVHQNRRVKSTEAFCTVDQWNKLRDETLRALHVGDRRPVVLAADAATKSDTAALVGCTWNEVTKKVDVCHFEGWEPEPGLPVKLTETIGPAIVKVHEDFNLVACYYDPYQMAAISELCARHGVNMVEFPQTTRRIQSDTHLHGLLWGGNLAHYGDPVLTEHVTNALSKKQGDRGLRIVKELSAKKVDGAVALAMAALGAVEELAGGQTRTMGIAKNPFYED